MGNLAILPFFLPDSRTLLGRYLPPQQRLAVRVCARAAGGARVADASKARDRQRPIGSPFIPIKERKQPIGEETLGPEGLALSADRGVSPASCNDYIQDV